ncbi:MAG TPA: magnesium transporter CorA family protein [Gammaproteobacteria bacterium]|nr:magnesium transporter CorA family protein [Gammaproteobacteria bacterium]
MHIFEITRDTPPRRIERADALPESGFLWLDFIRDEDPDWHETVTALTGTRIHERHILDSLNATHPSFYDGTAEYDELIFRSLAPETEEGQFATRPTAFFLLDRMLVTVRAPNSRSMSTVQQRLLDNTTRIPQRPADLMQVILNAMVDRFLAMREPLTDEMEAWSAALLDPHNPFDDWLALLGHRRQLRTLELLSEGQEDAVLAWRDSTRLDIDEPLMVRYNDLLEHIRRVTRFARIQQGEAESLVQLHFSAVSHRTNEIMRVLTVLSAIFLPLSFITGIFGMNFEYMPQLHAHLGYYFTLLGMGCGAVGLLVLFRLKKWI